MTIPKLEMVWEDTTTACHCIGMLHVVVDAHSRLVAVALRVRSNAKDGDKLNPATQATFAIARAGASIDEPKTLLVHWRGRAPRTGEYLMAVAQPQMAYRILRVPAGRPCPGGELVAFTFHVESIPLRVVPSDALVHLIDRSNRGRISSGTAGRRAQCLPATI